MSFWNNPGASFEGLAHDPWHSMQNFMTTGVVPMLPYIAGAIGGMFGPAGAAAAGGATQEGIDYFSGNSRGCPCFLIGSGRAASVTAPIFTA